MAGNLAENIDNNSGMDAVAKRVTKEVKRYDPANDALPDDEAGSADGDFSFIDTLNKEYAVVIIGDKIAILNEFISPDGKKDIRFLSVDSFKNWLKNKKSVLRVTKKDEEGNEITKTIKKETAPLWLASEWRRQYCGICFEPQKKIRDYYNLWQGFDKHPKTTNGKCTIFLDHVKTNVCSGKDELYNWVIGWFAHIIQHPTERVGTSLVLRGKQGCGKTVVGQVVGNLFSSHYCLADDARYVSGQFNAHMENCLLLQADEGFWAGDKQAESRLKGLVTSSHQFIERKGIDPVKVKNFVHLMITSNNDWVVPAGFEERRFCVIDVGDNVMQNAGYFGEMFDELNNGGYAALLEYLQKFDLSKVNLRDIPKTDALLEQKLSSLDPIKAWWLGCLSEGKIRKNAQDWEDKIPCESVYNSYLEHAGRIGEKHRAHQIELGIRLKKILPHLRRKKCIAYPDNQYGIEAGRPYFYELPSLDDCRKYFEKLSKSKLDWGDDDTDDTDKAK